PQSRVGRIDRVGDLAFDNGGRGFIAGYFLAQPGAERHQESISADNRSERRSDAAALLVARGSSSGHSLEWPAGSAIRKRGGLETSGGTAPSPQLQAGDPREAAQ